MKPTPNIPKSPIKENIWIGIDWNNVDFTAEWAYYYAKDAIKTRFPDGEDIIATDACFSYLYARYVIKGRFLKGESIIITSPSYSFLYARDVINGPFPEGEPIIATDPAMAYDYAWFIIKGRWLQGELTILFSEYANQYERLMIHPQLGENQE